MKTPASADRVLPVANDLAEVGSFAADFCEPRKASNFCGLQAEGVCWRGRLSRFSVPLLLTALVLLVLRLLTPLLHPLLVRAGRLIDRRGAAWWRRRGAAGHTTKGRHQKRS